MNLTNPLIAALEPLTSKVRTDVTAKKLADGTSVWTHDALTPERMARHLNGGPARGVCPIKEGESVTMVGVLDFDSHGGETPWHAMCFAAVAVAEAMQLAYGLHPVAFRSSGGRGIHLIVMWDLPQDAHSVRETLRQVLEGVGLHSGSGKRGVADGLVEIFPKQPEVKVGGRGNQFILPLAGASELLEYDDLSGAFIGVGKVAPAEWPLSAPVSVVERATRTSKGAQAATPRRATLLMGGEVPLWRQALDAIPNSGEHELEYEDWRNIVFAIHHETGGSDEGFDIALAWTCRAAAAVSRDPDHLETRVWPYIHSDGRSNPVTGGTICSYATRHHGWLAPITALGAIEDPDIVTVEVTERVLVPDPEGGVGVMQDVTREVVLEDPVFDRERSGAVKPTVSNTVLAVRRADLCSMRVGHDDFRDEITTSRPGVDEWAAMTDADLVRIRMRLESMGFKSAPKELCRDAIVLVAAENRYDSAQLWLGGLRWDGVPRVETFLVRYLGCEDTPYVRAVAHYLWTALAGRVLVPGVKADMVPIFEGDQGLRKSSAIEAMAPAPECFVEIDLEDREDDTVRKLRGALVGEIAELSGLHTRALEAIKKFVVRKTEKWVPKYKEFPSTFQRRVVFIGTTNRTDILADETGNRRWLPLHITSADVDGIVAARDQLWAEGAALFTASGVAWQDAERLAVVGGGAHDAYTVEDSWAELVAAWLDAPEPLGILDEEGVGRGGDEPRGDTPFTITGVLVGALKFAPGQIDARSHKRVGGVLRSLGYEPATVRNGNNVTRRWRRKPS